MHDGLDDVQTVALILAHLNANNAAQLVALLPDDMRPDVLTRMAQDPDCLIVATFSVAIEMNSFGTPRAISLSGWFSLMSLR